MSDSKAQIDIEKEAEPVANSADDFSLLVEWAKSIAARVEEATIERCSLHFQKAPISQFFPLERFYSTPTLTEKDK